VFFTANKKCCHTELSGSILLLYINNLQKHQAKGTAAVPKGNLASSSGST
jgi:hypothetical protein